MRQSDAQAEYQIGDLLSFMRFLCLGRKRGSKTRFL